MNLETILLNLLYREWVKVHDPFNELESFEDFIWNQTKKSVIQISEFEWAFTDHD